MPNNHTNSTSTNKNPIRPVLLADHATMRNYSASLRHFLTGLVEEACHPALICPPETGAGSILSPSVELMYHPIFKIPIFWLQNRKFVFEKLLKYKPTVLHSFCPAKLPLTRYLARRFDIPYVVTFNSLRNKFFTPTISAGHCGALIGSSKSITENLSRCHGRLAQRIEQVNIGTFVEDTCACFPDHKRVTSMVTTQQLNDSSDFEPLLSAARHLAIDGYEFVLAIIGSGPAEKDLHELIKALGLSQVVTIVSEIHPLRSVLADADIFIRPKPNNDFSIHLLEAMSVGMAIASCRGGVDDLLIEDQTAIFFEPQDEVSVYVSLQKLLDKREFARAIALGAQSHLRKHHTVTKMVASLLDLYHKTQQWYKQNGQ